MWADYLWPEFADASVLYVDELVDHWEVSDEEALSKEEVSEVLQPMLPSMVRWLRESTERYSALISAYEGIKNKLMGKVETVSSAEGNVETSGTTSNTGSSNTTEDYLETIVGKQGTESFSSLLNEFRETFLNIDMMVIDEFKDLFFGLW